MDKTYELAEKIRKEIEGYKFEKNLKLTVSIGLNQYKNQHSIDFIKEADDLLYRAKQNGRNRIETWYTLDKVLHNDIITFINENVDETSSISKDSERDTIAESILLDDK